MANRYRAILFDTEGTILPIDQEEFTRGYFRVFAHKLFPYGILMKNR